jgi:hypothetical protein
MDVGAGIMGFVRRNMGLRADVRCLPDLQDTNAGDDIDVGNFHLWRGTAGVTFRL